MIAHALHIVVNELNLFFTSEFSVPVGELRIIEGNIGMGVSGTLLGNVQPEKVVMTMVNYKEEKTLKNLPHYVRNDASLTVTYENQPVFLNFLVLVTATHTIYRNALIDLSRVIRFFQAQNEFTQDNVNPVSLAPGDGDLNALDHLESFKIIFDLYSPTLEELNHLWGTLGGRQYPSVMYIMRVLDLKFRTIREEGKLITEIIQDFSLKTPN